jgi:hypothetical protein
MKQPLSVYEATLQLVRQTSGPFTMPQLLPSLLRLFPGNSADETRLRLCDSLILLRQRGMLEKVGTSLPTTYQLMSKANNSPEQKADRQASKKMGSRFIKVTPAPYYNPTPKAPSKRDRHRMEVAARKGR